jgi:hypothetical protein
MFGESKLLVVGSCPICVWVHYIKQGLMIWSAKSIMKNYILVTICFEQISTKSLLQLRSGWYGWRSVGWFSLFQRKNQWVRATLTCQEKLDTWWTRIQACVVMGWINIVIIFHAKNTFKYKYGGEIVFTKIVLKFMRQKLL